MTNSPTAGQIDEKAFQQMTERLGIQGDAYIAAFNIVSLYESARQQPQVSVEYIPRAYCLIHQAMDESLRLGWALGRGECGQPVTAERLKELRGNAAKATEAIKAALTHKGVKMEKGDGPTAQQLREVRDALEYECVDAWVECADGRFEYRGLPGYGLDEALATINKIINEMEKV